MNGIEGTRPFGAQTPSIPIAFVVVRNDIISLRYAMKKKRNPLLKLVGLGVNMLNDDVAIFAYPFAFGGEIGVSRNLHMDEPAFVRVHGG